MLFNPVILVSRTLFIDGFGSVTVTHITTACALELVLRQPCRIVRAVKTDAPGLRQTRFDGGPAVLNTPSLPRVEPTLSARYNQWLGARFPNGTVALRFRGANAAVTYLTNRNLSNAYAVNTRIDASIVKTRRPGGDRTAREQLHGNASLYCQRKSWLMTKVRRSDR